MLSAETRTVIENVRWETFVELSEQRRGSVPRMTYDQGTLVITMHRLFEGIYQQIEESVALPGFTCAMADQLLGQRYAMGETALISAFRRDLSSRR